MNRLSFAAANLPKSGSSHKEIGGLNQQIPDGKSRYLGHRVEGMRNRSTAGREHHSLGRLVITLSVLASFALTACNKAPLISIEPRNQAERQREGNRKRHDLRKIAQVGPARRHRSDGGSVHQPRRLAVPCVPLRTAADEVADDEHFRAQIVSAQHRPRRLSKILLAVVERDHHWTANK